MSNQVEITPEDLAKSAKKFRKDLLMMPVIALQSSLNHMTLRMGVRGDETVGELSSDIEIGPYSETRTDTSDTSIKGRTLTTFRGSVIKKFSPNSVADSIYGSTVLSGDGLKNTDITTAVVGYLVKKVSKALNANLFKAVRNANGDTTTALFNGFDTIAAAEIAASEITEAKGNLYVFTEAITSTNAVDLLKAFYRAAKDELQGESAKLFISKDIYNAYVDDYQAAHGAVPYNNTFKKTYLEGTDDSCELVALPNKKGQPYIQLTTKGNMLIGVDQISQTETISVEKLDGLVLTLVMVMYFGVQYESISPERLLIGKLFVPAP
jgi:hypothetical protein